ncbi:MAG: GNAT family N-acetyltransferase [Propionicimonas sp.]|nr:GNAT family N-acetyltransferase [Propionicimonas sp.]
MVITQAGPADCTALAETSKRAFDADVLVGAPAEGGPPGYDSVAWHQDALSAARVFTIGDGTGTVIGGAIVFPRSGDEAYLGRIWLVPECQGKGLGALAMAELERLFPQVGRWTLGTPTWNLRNQRFYTRCGYRVIGREGEDGVLFEKLAGIRTG